MSNCGNFIFVFLSDLNPDQTHWITHHPGKHSPSEAPQSYCVTGSLVLVRLGIPWCGRKKFVRELLDAVGYTSVSSWAHHWTEDHKAVLTLSWWLRSVPHPILQIFDRQSFVSLVCCPLLSPHSYLSLCFSSQWGFIFGASVFYSPSQWNLVGQDLLPECWCETQQKLVQMVSTVILHHLLLQEWHWALGV